MYGGHVRTRRAACDSAFELRKFRVIAARGHFDVARRRVLHPTRDAEFQRALTDEPPETNPLHLPNDPQVDDRHVRMG